MHRRVMNVVLVCLAVTLFSSSLAQAQPTPPETRITSSVAGPTPDGHSIPMADGDRVPFNVATFSFTADKSPVTFTCTLDGVSEACESPVTYRGLAAGPHLFEVAGTFFGDTDETPATHRWEIGAMAGEVAADVRSLTPLDRVRVKPKRFRKLTGLPKGKAAQPGLRISDEFDPLELYPQEQGSTVCGLVCEALAELPTAPKLTSGPYLVNSSANDPNIAASRTHITVTNGTVIRFLTKAGEPLDKNENGTDFPGTINAAEFFKWFFDPSDPNNLNSGLNLPSGLQCDPAIYPWGSYGKPWGGGASEADKPKVADCLRAIYDARVIYDDFRGRFWVAASVRNRSHSAYMDMADPQHRAGRRDYLLVAVSVDDDPRHGWWMYAFPSTLDTGACNDLGTNPGPPPICPGSNYRPGDAADYPSLGISEDHLVFSIGVVSRNPWTTVGTTGYTNIFAADADQLASGGCASACGWSYGRMNVSFGSSLQFSPWGHAVQPAVQHDAMGGWTTLASNVPDLSSVVLFGFRASDGALAPPIRARIVPVAATGGPSDIPQKPESPVTAPQKLRIGNLGRMALKAVARDGDLWATWQDCRAWGPSATCTPSVRVVGIDAVSLLNSPLFGPCSECQTGVFLDKAAGGRRFLDPAGAYASYGMPALEVNGDRDLAVVSMRSGPHLFPEAVYHARFANAPGFEPEGLLQAGNFPLGSNDDPNDPGDDTTLNIDTAGAALDPRDDDGIWIYHGYSRKSGSVGIPGYAIGKLFGKRFFDINLFGSKAILLAKKKPSIADGLGMKFLVSNDGDKGSKASKVKVALKGKGGTKVLGKVKIPKMKSGAEKWLKASFALGGLKPGKYLLKLLVKRAKNKEYDVKNNTARRKIKLVA